MSRIRSTQCGVRWTTRIVPILIAGLVGYTAYATVKRVCIDFLYNERGETGLVLTFLILYFLFLCLSIATYLRTIWVVKTDPGVVDLLPDSRGAKIEANRRAGRGKEDIEAQVGWWPPDEDPDSPGLENFYRKDAFICESDGRPRWCHDCGQWKPDRASHSREIGRCVRKMDHYCPWVGGMVSETCRLALGRWGRFAV
jgi:palmitoyltransferase